MTRRAGMAAVLTVMASLAAGPGLVSPVSVSSASAARVVPAVSIALDRIAGPTRDATSVAASQELFPAAGSARAVVVASNATFPDALAGAPLAVLKGGPLLLTTPTGLDPLDAAEISRALPPGGAVYLLGGPAALSPALDTQVSGLGYVPHRVAGANRYATAVAIAAVLGNPTTVLLATGLDFPDGLAAGAAAAHAGAAVLLTAGSTMPAETAAYLGAHPGSPVAVGGPATAADPGALRVVGADRYATAAAVATQFFPGSAATVGFASGAAFPDALSGGANIGGHGGPLLLVPAAGLLPAPLSSYLSTNPTITTGLLYGGPAAVGADVATELAARSAQVGSAARISAGPVVGLACPSTLWCMAVDGLGRAVADVNGVWSAPVVVDNGANSQQPTGEFDGISCPTTVWCMAVSYLDGYAIYSNGSWGPMTRAPVGIENSDHAVSCSAPSSCVTEADNFGDLAFYNGAWAQPASPPNGIGINDAGPTPLSCVPSLCLYVAGASYQTVTATGLSGPLAIDPTATGSVPNVSCTLPTFCVVAFADTGMAEVWNGTAFTSAGRVVGAGDPSPGLTAVSCSGTATPAAVVGPAAALAPRFCGATSARDLYSSPDGRAWTHVGQFLSPLTPAAVTALACPAVFECVVGSSDGVVYTLNPSIPVTQPIPTP